MEKIATVSGSDSGGCSSAKYAGQSPARATTTARPNMIVSVEKMPTSILRKLEIPLDLKVVAAQISTVKPRSAPSRFAWMVVWIERNKPDQRNRNG